MSTRQEGAQQGAGSPLVTSRADLVGWIAAGEKPKDAWRICT